MVLIQTIMGLIITTGQVMTSIIGQKHLTFGGI